MESKLKYSVKCGLIDELGGLFSALSALKEMIKEEKRLLPDKEGE